ncbi:hypothetical protein, partial [Cylindrospermopsis raciborskii]|uniref:hypothetical protein n=1 Tax=Cylindrospermopsis raciborskii TaxID=77022 RepID=UPI0038D1C57E
MVNVPVPELLLPLNDQFQREIACAAGGRNTTPTVSAETATSNAGGESVLHSFCNLLNVSRSVLAILGN